MQTTKETLCVFQKIFIKNDEFNRTFSAFGPLQCNRLSKKHKNQIYS